MENLIGNMVRVFMISGDKSLDGILIGFEEDLVYLQKMDNSEQTYVIPEKRISHYLVEKILLAPSVPIVINNEELRSETKIIPNELEVHIDAVHITTIPLPPTFNLAVFSDDILRIIWGNPDVRSILTGKNQESLEYFPGKVIIKTQSTPIVLSNNESSKQVSFNMGVSSPAMSFLSPSDMVLRLNNIVKPKA